MAKTNNPFEQLTSLFSQFKVPGLDADAFTKAAQDNVKAFTEAGQALQQSMQEFGQKQNEIITSAMAESQQAVSGAVKAGGSKPDPTKHAEQAQAVFQKAMDNMKELAEIARSGQADAMTVLGKRGAEQLAELKTMTKSES